jgi:cytoskeletal protein CcmA (bactofilin family)
MASSEVQTITTDESCLTSQLTSDLTNQNLPGETKLTFQEWLGNQPQEKVESRPSSQVPNQPSEIAFEGTLRVDGYMAGVVRSDQGNLILSVGGVIDGDVSVNDATINGTVRGDIRATTRIEIGSSARVIGDIETAQLLIHPGAVFEGRCTFTSNSEAAQEAACR